MYKYVFGPVMSGRLGRSLGLDLLGRKICSLDCVYCEVGRTLDLTMERAPYVPAKEILSELESWKKEERGLPDYITLGGSGEPTLNSEMPEVISGVREMFPGIPVAVLTNSTLLHDPQVREELAAADVVLPSLDSLVPEEFRRVNRPHREVEAETAARGLLDFRVRFDGKIFLEILLVAGYNDSEENKVLLADYAGILCADRVDVVTLSRPGTLDTARAVSSEKMAEWKKALGAAPAAAEKRQPESMAEAGDAASRSTMQREQLREAVPASVRRRPQTIPQLASALGVSEHAVTVAVEELLEKGIVTRDEYGFCRAQ